LIIFGVFITKTVFFNLNKTDTFMTAEKPADNTKSKTKKHRKYLIILWLLFFIPVIGLYIFFSQIAQGNLGFMPTFEQLENPKSNLATEIITQDGEVLGTYFRENRTKAKYSDLSPYLIDALIATEDARYEEHSGIDLRSLGRVVFKTVLGGNRNKGGGSTISQQLAKMLFPREEFSSVFDIVTRKAREWVIAVRLEKSYTKEEIMAMYFNKFDFLYLAVGINTASHVYYGKKPNELKIEEAAMLVGMAKNPSLYNPLRDAETALTRRNVVLSQMLKYEKISETMYDSLKELPLDVNFHRVDHKTGVAPYFREFLRVSMTANKPFREDYNSFEVFHRDSLRWENDPLYGWCNKFTKGNGDSYDIYSDGLKIYTTLNYKMQEYAETAVRKHLKDDLQPIFFKEQKGRRRAPYSWELSSEQYNLIMKQNIHQTDRYQAMRRKKISRDSIYKVFDIPVKMKVFSWNGPIDTVLSPLDSIKYMKHFLHAGLLSLEPKTGYVKAFVGGIDYNYFQYDHAYTGRRQVGSTFKPFLYTLAMQEGLTPCHKVPNVPTTFQLADTTWTPGNADTNRLGEMVTLSWGLANSNNYISAKLMKMFNPRPVINIAREMGVTSRIPAVPAICLGVSEHSLYEMVGAFGSFINKGVYTQPIFVTKIEDKYGNVISTFVPKRNEAISEETAFLMVNLMENVVNRGTSVRLRYKYKMYNELAGKTGTTNDHSDGWFIGFDPNLVTGVWVGGDERSIRFKSIRDGQGANMALPIWAEYMLKVYNDSLDLKYYPSSRFEKPAGVDYSKIDCRKASTLENQNLNKTDDEFEDVPDFY